MSINGNGVISVTVAMKNTTLLPKYFLVYRILLAAKGNPTYHLYYPTTKSEAAVLRCCAPFTVTKE